MALVKLNGGGSEELGYIYVLSNPSFPDLLKIGFSLDDPEERAQQLSSTSVPYAFQVEFETFCEDPRKIEQRVHGRLHKYRVNSNREFFKTSVDKAEITILSIVTGVDLSEGEGDAFVTSFAQVSQIYKIMLKHPTRIKGIDASDPTKSAAKFLTKNFCDKLKDGDQLKEAIDDMLR